ncbi:MAG TPA: hypothetical protein VF132_00030 [Rudaea sp.]
MAFECEALDPDAVIWKLHMTYAGGAVLRYDDCIVAQMPILEGMRILQSENTPAEMAEEIVARMTSDLAVQIHERARMALESDLSRWIAGNS